MKPALLGPAAISVPAVFLMEMRRNPDFGSQFVVQPCRTDLWMRHCPLEKEISAVCGCESLYYTVGHWELDFDSGIRVYNPSFDHHTWFMGAYGERVFVELAVHRRGQPEAEIMEQLNVKGRERLLFFTEYLLRAVQNPKIAATWH